MSEKTEDKGRETIILGGDEKNLTVAIRGDGDEVRIGHLQKTADGEPLLPGASLVELEPDERGLPRARMRTLYESDLKPQRTKKGPPQAATRAYLSGWERIWGPKKKDDTVN